MFTIKLLGHNLQLSISSPSYIVEETDDGQISITIHKSIDNISEGVSYSLLKGGYYCCYVENIMGKTIDTFKVNRD